MSAERRKPELPHADDMVGVPKRFREHPEPVEEGMKADYEQRGAAPIEGLELEKTERDREILRFAETAVDRYMAAFGRTKRIPLPDEKIHVLREGGTDEYTDGRVQGGSHASTGASMLVDRFANDAQFAAVAFHEMWHLKGYQVLQITEPKGDGAQASLKAYRSGFGVVSRDGKERWFSDVEEALTGIMTQRFVDERLRVEVSFAESVDEIEVSRDDEAVALRGMLKDIIEKNPDFLGDEDDLLKLCFEGQVNGRFLEIARIIEKTYGTGSFRRLGEGEFPHPTGEGE